MSEGGLLVRPATAADASAIRAVVASAFGQTGEADLVEALERDGDAVLSLVAGLGHGVSAHLMLSRMQAPFRAAALAPLAVIPQAQGRGIGAALVRAAIGAARTDGWAALFVLGDPAYYRPFGFDPALAAGFASPYAGRHFMALALTPPLPTLSGALVHAPAFAALG